MVTSTLEDGNEAKLVMGIDDEPTILQFLRAIVGQAGYKFADASSGEKALALARQAKPDLVFLDVTMDGIDGYQTCRRLRAEIPDFTAPARPRTLATVAPVPAPTLPSSMGSAPAARQAARPSPGPGRTSDVIKPRSNRMAADTMGMIVEPTLTPMPCSAR